LSSTFILQSYTHSRSLLFTTILTTFYALQRCTAHSRPFSSLSLSPNKLCRSQSCRHASSRFVDSYCRHSIANAVAYQTVDRLTCSLISEHLNNPTSLTSHLLRRSPQSAGGLDTAALSDILASCNKSGNSQHNRKPVDHSHSGGQDEGTIGNGRYPPFDKAATTSTVGSGGSANAGSGNASQVGTGAGGGRSDVASSNVQPASSSSNSNTSSGNTATTSAAASGGNGQDAASSNSRISSGGNNNRLPFNPASAPYTVTRRTVAPASHPVEAAPSTASKDAEDEPSPQDFSAHSKSPQRPTKNTKNNVNHIQQNECVGQVDSITCPLQALAGL
jgi:hypothetical protein